MKMRIQKDLMYINNWSFWLDVKIILQTAITIASHEAY
jgi:putative colanic acid biosysnthesis UDP-glucose lipid carrier transferase